MNGQRGTRIGKGHVAHLTSVHPANDTRIFLKECTTLADAGYQVTLVAKPPRAEFNPGSVKFIEFRIGGNRAVRMVFGAIKMLRLALSINADVYHFHDPEVIPVGMVLKLLGKRVIYDVHEDVPAQIMGKSWIPRILRRPVSVSVSLVHRLANVVFDGIVVAREDAAEGFRGPKVVLVQNFPVLAEFQSPDGHDSQPTTDPYRVVYVGGISAERGIREMITAVDHLAEKYPVQFELAGPFQGESLQDECELLPGWEHVRYHPWVDRTQMSRLLADASVGLLLFHPIPNHVTSYPNKLFEYMSAALPIVASNFPYWRQFVSDTGTGIMVDPFDTRQIADAIEKILNDPEMAQRMGEAGASAVRERWNWEAEGEKLTELVASLLEVG